MSVPYEIVDLAFVLGAIGLLAAWGYAARVAGRLPARLFGDADAGQRTRRVRRGSVVLLVVLGLGLIGLSAAGAPIGPFDQPLSVGGSWGGSDPLLLAIEDVRPGPSQFLYAYRPDAQIRTGLTLANNGNAALTVTGLEPPEHPVYVRSYELLLPPGQLTLDLVPVYPGEEPVWTSEPFYPFEIPAHGEVALGFAVDLNACAGLKPVPTLGPGTSLSSELGSSYSSYSSGFTAASQIRIDYTAFGVSRTATVSLQSALEVVTDSSRAGCPAP
jgi:hypothetical protein